MTGKLLGALLGILGCQIGFCVGINYPVVRRDEGIRWEYDGTSVKDPYRWLEDGNSEETGKFIQEENKLSSSVLGEVLDKGMIEETVEELWLQPQFQSVPIKAASKYYYCKHLEKWSSECVIYVQKELEGEPKVFFDPKELPGKKKGESISVRNFGFSKDGRIFSYCFTLNSSEWETCQFKHTETGDDLPDKIEGLKYASLQWSHDNKGFFYTAYPLQSDGKSREFIRQQGWYHILGTKQSDDVLILQFPDAPSWKIGFKVSDCGKHLLAFPKMGPSANSVYITSLERGIYPFMIWRPIFVDIREARYEYLTNNGSVFYFRTDRRASKFQVVQVETDKLKNPRSAFVPVIPEDPDNLLAISRAVAQTKLLLVYKGNLDYKIEIRNRNDGSLFEKLELNETGSVMEVSEDIKDENELFIHFESLTIPGRIYHCRITEEDAVCHVFKNSELDALGLSNLEVNIVNYPSKDKFFVPMILVHKKGMVKNETTPLLLGGYADVNTPLEQQFHVAPIIFVKYFDGIYAVPGVRGGSHQGESSDPGVSRNRRQLAFDDFISAANYLIQEKYTQQSKLIIRGNENGAILTGVCLNRMPELFGAAIFMSGVFDVVRYQQLGGEFWGSKDFDVVDTKEEFSALLRFSPMHTIQRYIRYQYPPIFVLNHAQDRLVPPFHSYKFTAELQNRIGDLKQQTNPLLLMVDTQELGNFKNKQLSKIKQWSAVFTFIQKTVKIEFNSGKSFALETGHTLILLACVSVTLIGRSVVS